MKKFYITTAIDYVNAKPHLGHAYEKICADIIARWKRLEGFDVFFLTGTDENAQKNKQAAEKAGIPVRKFVDQNANFFIEMCKVLNISYDEFIRTTEERHIKVSQQIFQKIFDKGDIYKGKYEGLYCTGCEAFKTEKDLVNGRCPEHKEKPKFISEESYFFKLSKYKAYILDLIKNKGLIFPKSKENEILQRLNEEELKDLCVSRNSLEWGINVPFDKTHTIYVWMDALVNYISAIGYTNDPKFKKYWPADMHIIGKGINWFHTVIWPAILKSADIEPPKLVPIHGYITINGKKISKSLGNVIDPVELVKKYPADTIRYYLAKVVPYIDDGDFSEKSLKERINGELVSDLGNLVNRVLTLSDKFSGKIEGTPELDKKLDFQKIQKKMDKLELHHALEEIWQFVRECNKYVNEKEPWKLEGKELSHVLYNLLEALRVTSILIHPFIPTTSEKINQQLGTKLGTFKDLKFKEFKGKPKKGELLFEKVQ
ncbi:MAG: methionine--tRNA ligase [Candidatus Aenigmarchaeota archaeon]|nr:methionine--tRNA ligase [Candidatus Aenigmarchaeota archaeon]